MALSLSPTEEAELTKEMRDGLLSSIKSDKHNRDSCTDNKKFLNGEQWDSLESQKRRNKRLMLTGDQLNAPVDQVANAVKQNPPGPKVDPSGEGTDRVDAQIMEGILRRIDYDANAAQTCFAPAMEDATGGNFGCWAVDMEWKSERSFERIFKPRYIPDANARIYFDPTATEKDRSDSTWAMELYIVPISTYKAKYPNKSDGSPSKVAMQGPFMGVLNYFNSFRDDSLKGWISDAGVQLARYWRVVTTTDNLRLYSDGLSYFDSEKDIIPTGVEEDESQNVSVRERREIRWYLMNATEILDSGVWPGYWIPLIPVYGRERWIEGKRYISALIELAKQAQQAFNFAFTGACEVLSSTPKSPWLGLLGQFKSKYNQWKTANTEPHSFIEFDPVSLPNGETYVTPPERMIQEPPIQAHLAFCNLCSMIIQRATSIFDTSLGKQKSDTSGKAAEILDKQSSEGNFHWSANLTVALNHYYRLLGDLVQNEYDSDQVVQILRADGSPMAARINATFKQNPSDKNSAERKYNIAKGTFAYTVSVGQSYDSQMQANSLKITALIKSLPPELIAQCADLIIKLQNYGPLGDELAQRLAPAAYRDKNDPQAAAAQVAQLTQQNQTLNAAVQKLQYALATKQPELEVRKWIAAVGAIADIEMAKIKAGDAQADREQDTISDAVGLAHDTQQQQHQRIHEVNLADINRQTQLDAANVAASAKDDSSEGDK